MQWHTIMRRPPSVWVLILLAVVLWGGEYVRRGLWEPDEARYAYVAREMQDGGHWFVPHIHNTPYPDKPPLMFWLINASSLLTGGRINGVSARLPSLLGCILTLWVVVRLLSRWHSAEAAWRGVGILLTSYLFWHEGGWGRIDALLCGLVSMSVYFFFEGGDTSGNRKLAAAYLFAGLAVLAKGPVGLALPVGIYAASLIVTGRKAALKRWHWLWGIALALAVPACWLAFAWHSHPPGDYFTRMFTEKSFNRVVSSVGHNHGVLYFLWHFPLEFLPWTMFLPAAYVGLSGGALRRRLLAWWVFVIGLFSLFVCKRNVYILPAYPAAAMLVAVGWKDIPALPRRLVKMAAGSAVGLVWIMAMGETVALFVPQIPFARWVLAPCAVVTVAGGVWLSALWRRRGVTLRWLAVLIGVLFVHQVCVSVFVYPAMDTLKAPPAFGRQIGERLPPDRPLYLYQQQLAILPLLADRKGRVIHSIEELRAAVGGEAGGVVVFKDSVWKSVRSQVNLRSTPHEFTLGHKHLVWVEFGGAERGTDPP